MANCRCAVGIPCAHRPRGPGDVAPERGSLEMKMEVCRLLRAAGWFLCASVLCVTSTRGQESQQPDLSGMSIEDLAKLKVDAVYGASKFLRNVADSPASVTVVNAEQIQKYGYRTLADVLRSVPGFYVIYDRNYTYVGVRGISRSGDYNARILFLLDGHRVNDDIYDGAYVGTEFPVNVDLMERIEIIKEIGRASCRERVKIGEVDVTLKKNRRVEV